MNFWTIRIVIFIIILVVGLLVLFLWYLPSQQVTEEIKPIEEEISKPIEEEISKPIEEEIKPIEKETVPYSFINKQITTHLDKGKCVDNISGPSKIPGAKVVLWVCHGADNQSFSFNEKGKQQIIAKHSGLCLRGKNDDNIVQDACDLSGTKWSYDENKKLFKNEDTGKCMSLFVKDINDIKNGAYIKLWDCNDKDNQKWEISPIKLT